VRSALKKSAPGRGFERELWDGGCETVVGIDEVGRGAWAGPLTLAAVVVPRSKRLHGVRDSKMLSAGERAEMAVRIGDWADHVSVGQSSAAECDELGMSAAQKIAAQRALAGLGCRVDHVLVDGNWDFVETVPTTMLVKGDAKSISIAAASIVAKHTRDQFMIEAAARYPSYWFHRNKGYPCPRHKAALAGVGPSAIHRRRWAFMDDLRWSGQPRIVDDDAETPQLELF